MKRLALERERLGIRKSASELQQLKLKLELERLQQKRVSTSTPIKADTTPPIIQAKQSLITRSAVATIEGMVKDDGKIVRVEFDGRKIDTIEGWFSIKAPVNLGRNTIRIAAFDSNGNRA